MMNKLILLLLCINCLVLEAQNTYTVKDTMPNIHIIGTSTLHDWKVQAGSVNNYPDTLTVELKEGASLNGFSFQVDVASLDGGRGASMNTKIQTAFNSTDHPSITFTQNEAAILKTAEEGGYLVTTKGLLSMAGIEKPIMVEAVVQKTDGHLIVKGSKDLKMSDFGMTPPSAMFGQIQTKDAITVHFEFVYVE